MTSNSSVSATTTEKKLDELYELIEEIEVSLMTTRRPDGRLVTRPMATQEREAIADLWFVTNGETEKIDEIEFDDNVNLGYYDSSSREWVSVSGVARLSTDRKLISKLHRPDWKMWFGDEGGERDGGPNDPRLALILVDIDCVHYMTSKHSKPRVLFELVKGLVTGSQPDVGREEHLDWQEIAAKPKGRS